TIGLHQRDNARLIAALHTLRDAGNTVIVIEHDEEMMRAADYIVDLGPGAGRHGGDLVAAGAVAEMLRHPVSLTARFLRGELAIPMPAQRRKADLKNSITLRDVRTNNLRGIDVSFPLGVF